MIKYFKIRSLVNLLLPPFNFEDLGIQTHFKNKYVPKLKPACIRFSPWIDDVGNAVIKSSNFIFFLFYNLVYSVMLNNIFGLII